MTSLGGNDMRQNHRDDALKTMERLYGQFYRKLFLYALTYLEDEEEARDAVSELFIQLWNKWEEDFSAVKDVSLSFLYTMLRSRCIDKIRRISVKSRYLQQLENDRFDNDSDVKEYEEKVMCLTKAIQDLPEPGKTILRHCYFDSMTYQQTAEHTGISLPMVKKHMAMMFRLLRERLKNDKGGRLSYLISLIL